MIGSFTMERRFETGKLAELDLPLREVQKGIIAHSPIHVTVDERYSMADLLKYSIEDYQPPQEISGAPRHPRRSVG